MYRPQHDILALEDLFEEELGRIFEYPAGTRMMYGEVTPQGPAPRLVFTGPSGTATFEFSETPTELVSYMPFGTAGTLQRIPRAQLPTLQPGQRANLGGLGTTANVGNHSITYDDESGEIQIGSALVRVPGRATQAEAETRTAAERQASEAARRTTLIDLARDMAPEVARTLAGGAVGQLAQIAQSQGLAPGGAPSGGAANTGMTGVDALLRLMGTIRGAEEAARRVSAPGIDERALRDTARQIVEGAVRELRPSLDRITDDLLHSQAQREATSEHREITATDQYRRRVLNKLREIETVLPGITRNLPERIVRVVFG